MPNLTPPHAYAVSKYKTEASLLCGNIKKRKAQWGVECYDLMHPDYQVRVHEDERKGARCGSNSTNTSSLAPRFARRKEDEVKRRFKLVLAHVQKLEGQLNKVQEKIDNLDYGKEPKEGAKKAGKDAEEKLAEDLDEKVAVAQP